MHTEGNSQPTINGWQHLGKVMEWIVTQPLSLAERFTYLAVARRTIGYNQYTSEVTSYVLIATLAGVSIDAVKRAMPKLIEQGFIIKLATNQVANAGKLPYKYQLNMKLPNFPGLGNLKQGRDDVAPTKQPWDERTQLYFIDATDSILPLYTGNNPDNRRSTEWFNHTFSTDLSEVIYPTTEQLLIYLKEQV